MYQDYAVVLYQELSDNKPCHNRQRLYDKGEIAIACGALLVLDLDTRELLVQKISDRLETMKLAWLTDIHLNFVGRSVVEGLCNTIHTSGADAILITGDIATSVYLTRYLEYLADNLKRPIYFVLGNHDYYGSSIRNVNAEVAKVANEKENLFWL